MRLLIFELRLPMLRSEGLAAALQARLEAVEARVGLDTDFRVEGEGQLSPEVEEGLYRIAQEALNNALRHARARSVSVLLHLKNETVVLEVTDDGIGFDPTAACEQGGFGLRGMEERAARLGGILRVDSHPEEGSKITVEVHQ
jgi:signal transduction histidine kinase